jgi:hypothetical protein
VYLDKNELYLPSDIGSQLAHTNPTLNVTTIKNAPAPLSLSDLEQLNAIGNCDVDHFSNCPIYLTSKDNVTANPPWLNGVLPDPVTGEAAGTKSCAIIVNDHGNGIVDAYYMYFYAFNLGPTVLGQVLGDHVGDWEHTMVRFTNGTPTSMWFSQHDVSHQISSRSKTYNNNKNRAAKSSLTPPCPRMAPAPSSTAPSAPTPTSPSQAPTPAPSPP